jgi:hypothetical protein
VVFEKEQHDFMKTLSILALVGVVGITLTHVIAPTPVRADNVMIASKQLATTEHDLKDAVTTTRAQAGTVAQGLDQPNREDALPTELQEFNHTTERLIALRETLRRDIDTYQTAATTKLAEFAKEQAAITDEATQRSMCSLRRHTEDDIKERLDNARNTLDQLDTVLAKGNDLGHAAKCVLIADSLHQHGEDVDQQLQQARTTAAQYATTTGNLLARINHAIAD